MRTRTSLALSCLALAILLAPGQSRGGERDLRAEAARRAPLPPPRTRAEREARERAAQAEEEREDEEAREEAERVRHGGPERDDARARRDGRRAEEAESPPVPALLARQLLEARRERDLEEAAALRLKSAGPQQSALRVQGNVWVNVGPTRSDSSYNGATYYDVDSGRVRTLIPHPSDPGILYVATSGGGVWKTWDAGLSWNPLTDRLGSTSVGALAMDPAEADILYLGFGDPFDVAQPGLVASTDGGATWSDPVFLSGGYNDAAGVRQPALASTVRDLQVDPTSSLHLLVATDLGLFQSSDAGRSFTQTGLPSVHSFAQAWSIAWLGGQTWLVTGQDMNVANVDASGNVVDGQLLVWRSADGGSTWADVTVKVSRSAPSIGRGTLAVAPTSRGSAQTRVYLLTGALDGFSTWDVFRSDDAGNTWTALAVNGSRRPKNPNADVGDLDILSGQAFYNQALLVDPENQDVVFVGGELGMIRSRDAGATWEVLSDWLPASTNLNLPYIHADYHAFAVGWAGGTKTFYVGTDGGVFRSTDLDSSPPGQTHISDVLNHGLVTHLVYSVSCAPKGWPDSLQGFMLGGLQDDGTRMRSLGSTHGPDTFNQVFGGDGFGTGVSRDTDASGTWPALMLTSLNNGRYFGAFAGGTCTPPDQPPCFDKFGSDVPGVAFHTRITSDLAADDGMTFLTVAGPTAGSGGIVWRSTSGSDWTFANGTIHALDGSALSVFVSPVSTAAIALNNLDVHPLQAGVWGVSGSGGVVFVTNDAGANWWQSAPVGSNPTRPNLFISRIVSVAFDLRDPTGSTLWVGAAGSQVFEQGNTTTPSTPVTPEFGHLFYSADRGKTWESRPGAPGHRLPNVPVNVVRIDPGDPDTIYVGTDFGLYRSIDAGQDFDRYGTGLPLVRVTDACVAPGSGSIKVSTYGRGFWEIDTGPGGVPAGARGRGDLDFNQKLDAFDLIDLVAAMGATAQSDDYRPEADLAGASNRIDDADLAAFLERAGGAP